MTEYLTSDALMPIAIIALVWAILPIGFALVSRARADRAERHTGLSSPGTSQ